MYFDIAREIEELREKLHESITKNGINSTKTMSISKKLNILINQYHNNEEKK